MNRIYKVIWSRVKHCYVVVSELTKSAGKGNISAVSGHSLCALVCVLAVMGCLAPGMAGASFNGGIGATTATANSIASGMMLKRQSSIRWLSAAGRGQLIYMLSPWAIRRKLRHRVRLP